MVSVPESVFLRIVRTSAWYDLTVTTPFAAPWTLVPLYQALNTLTYALGMDGLPAFEPMCPLMANLIGPVVCV